MKSGTTALGQASPVDSTEWSKVRRSITCLESAYEDVLERAQKAEALVAWMQKVSTLHRSIDILYVVDGYEVTILWDDHPISESFRGETLEQAIDKAMATFDLNAPARWRDV